MIKIEIIGPNGENLLSGTMMQKVKRLGLPTVGLVGGMILSFFLASSLVTDRTDSSVKVAQDKHVDTFKAGVDYALPTMNRDGAAGASTGVAKLEQTTPYKDDVAAKSDTGKGAVEQKKMYGNLVTETHAKELVAKGAAANGKKIDQQANARDAVDPMLDERIQAAREWLTANNGDGSFSIQLMSVRRSSLGGLKEYLAKANLGLSEDKLYAFPFAKDRLLLYYGRYATYSEATQAIASLPASIRSQKPFVLSGKEIHGKLAHLNKTSGKKDGLVAALKP
ncbi:MAG: hypothetical protein HQL79_01290 [Magnetococcales bacterium]|nr:hypothetical protein [Magnetococcales bacterium]